MFQNCKMFGRDIPTYLNAGSKNNAINLHSLSVESWPTILSRILQLPDEPFHNSRASKSVNRLILCSSRTSCDVFQISKNVKGLVG